MNEKVFKSARATFGIEGLSRQTVVEGEIGLE